MVCFATFSCEFLFVSLLVIFNFFPPNWLFLLSYTSTWLATCGKSLPSLDLERYRVEDWYKNCISPLSPGMYVPLCNSIEEHEITKQKEKIFGSNPGKGHKNKHKKTRRKWNDTKCTIWCFPQCPCVNAIYFAPVVTTTYRMKNNKSSTRGLCLEMSVFDRARAQMLNMLYISTHQSVPHGGNI